MDGNAASEYVRVSLRLVFAAVCSTSASGRVSVLSRTISLIGGSVTAVDTPIQQTTRSKSFDVSAFTVAIRLGLRLCE
jgi:hypothetical protein